MKLPFSILAATLVLVAGCSSVTLTKSGTGKLSSDPTYQSSKAFFFWGLAGVSHVDVKDVCGNRGARQMQTQTTFLDGLLGGITLGIYSPRTAKVWCDKGDQS